MDDPNFEHTVIYVLHIDDDGAVGVVINRPAEVTVSTVLPRWSPYATSPGTVMKGGPVAQNGLLGVALTPGGVSNIDLTEEPTAGVVSVRVFAGYAGWGPGQLEDELDEGSWLVVDPRPGDLWSARPAELWNEVLARQPGTTSWLALCPPDPSAN